MLILVAVTVRTVIQSGLFGHAGKATSGYSMHEAREQLGTTLAGAMTEKYTNKDYDEDDYLTEYIKDNLPGSKVADNVVLVDGWAFEIDRSVPGIVNDLGKGNPEDFKAPDLTVTKGTLADDKLSIPLNITALEDTNGISKIEVYKVGVKDPVETFTCSGETTAVNKTYTATENAKYKIVAYSKLRATKAIEVTEIVIPIPQIGDLVRYTPDTAGNYTGLTATTCGSSKNTSSGIPQDTTLKWKVMSINDDGTIDLIADKPISTIVYFKGALGYSNGVYLLNDLCKSLYSNSSLSATARSINLVDIEKHFKDVGIAARNSYTYSVQYGDTKTYTDTRYTYTLDIYKNHDKNVTSNPNNIAKVESEDYYSTTTTPTSAQESSLTLMQTGYEITSLATYYDAPEFHSIVFGSNEKYWLASRAISINSPYAGFGLRLVSAGSFSWYSLFAANNSEYNDYGYSVRPVVTLGVNVKLKPISGSTEWEIVHK